MHSPCRRVIDSRRGDRGKVSVDSKPSTTSPSSTLHSRFLCLPNHAKSIPKLGRKARKNSLPAKNSLLKRVSFAVKQGRYAFHILKRQVITLLAGVLSGRSWPILPIEPCFRKPDVGELRASATTVSDARQRRPTGRLLPEKRLTEGLSTMKAAPATQEPALTRVRENGRGASWGVRGVRSVLSERFHRASRNAPGKRGQPSWLSSFGVSDKAMTVWQTPRPGPIQITPAGSQRPAESARLASRQAGNLPVL